MINLINRLKGTGVALITPFKSDLSVDYDVIGKLVDFVINGGVNYIVVQGTTGEYATLSENEKVKCREAFVEANEGRVPLVIGIGSNYTDYLVDYINKSDLTGFSALLSVSPYYNKPTQEGLFQHFSKLALSSKLPIILYNVPSRTGCNMDPKTTIRLAKKFKNIIGIKEAKGDIKQMNCLIQNKPPNFLVLSGDDDTAATSILNGADGVISVAAGSIPKLFSKTINYALNKDKKNTKILIDLIKPYLKLLFDEGNPSGTKAALSILKICQNKLRLPLIPVSESLYTKIEKFISQNPE